VVTTVAGPIICEATTSIPSQFSNIVGITVGSDSNIYVTNPSLGIYGTGCIQRITPSGNVSVIAMEHARGITADGQGNLYLARSAAFFDIAKLPLVGGTPTPIALPFSKPDGITVDGQGNLFVGNDPYDYGPLSSPMECLVEKVTPTGTISIVAGVHNSPSSVPVPSCGYSDNADPTLAQFSAIPALAVAQDGVIYVPAEDAIRKIAPSGAITTLAGAHGSPGSSDGTGAAARFNGVNGIALAADGNLYVTDTGNHTIRRVSPSGMVVTVAGKTGVAGDTNSP
jgi:sugar lactone lactonase YvrE